MNPTYISFQHVHQPLSNQNNSIQSRCSYDRSTTLSINNPSHSNYYLKQALLNATYQEPMQQLISLESKIQWDANLLEQREQIRQIGFNIYKFKGKSQLIPTGAVKIMEYCWQLLSKIEKLETLKKKVEAMQRELLLEDLTKPMPMREITNVAS